MALLSLLILHSRCDKVTLNPVNLRQNPEYGYEQLYQIRSELFSKHLNLTHVHLWEDFRVFQSAPRTLIDAVLREATDEFREIFELFPPHAKNFLNRTIFNLQVADLERSLAPEIARLVEKRRVDILDEIKIRLAHRVIQIVNATSQTRNLWKVLILDVKADSMVLFATETRKFQDYPAELRQLATQIYNEDSKHLARKLDILIAAQRSLEGSLNQGIFVVAGVFELGKTVYNWFTPAQDRSRKDKAPDTDPASGPQADSSSSESEDRVE
jgi:hypothetical protein